MTRNAVEMKTYSTGKVTFDPAGTGSGDAAHKLTIPLTYSGEAKANLFDFLTSVGKSAVQACFAIDGPEAAKAPEGAGWLTVIGKFGKSGLSADGTKVELSFVIANSDVRTLREYLDLACEAARVDAHELDAKFEIVQAELPLEGDERAA